MLQNMRQQYFKTHFSCTEKSCGGNKFNIYDMGSKESKQAEMGPMSDATVSKADIQAEVDSNMIVIYVSKSCPYCQVAMKALSASGFEAKIVDANPSQRSVSYIQVVQQTLP